MDPRRLLIFRAVARAGSISAAARELGWTQPAVSQHLRTLEREAGSALLLRGPTGVELTEPGRVLLARADAVASHLHMAEEELSAIGDLRRGQVRLVAYPTAAATWAPGALAGLRQRHPDIDVTLAEMEPPEAVALLERGDADLALVFGYDGDPVAGSRDLRWIPVGAEPVDLVLPPDHPAAEKRRLGMAQLRDESWIAGCDRCRAHLVGLCESAGFTPDVRHVSDDYVVVQNLVAAGLGISMLPRSATTAYRNPDVHVRPSRSWGARRFGIAHRDGAEAVPANAAVIRELHKHRL
ncbi:MAG TPA: LysR family transcriptional regulator [Nocardioides sp.]|nr:LysR family transcriptional regulator [Nocardioides sp.]